MERDNRIKEKLYAELSASDKKLLAADPRQIDSKAYADKLDSMDAIDKANNQSKRRPQSISALKQVNKTQARTSTGTRAKIISVRKKQIALLKKNCANAEYKDKCYLCKKQGHFARECPAGATLARQVHNTHRPNKTRLDRAQGPAHLGVHYRRFGR